MAAEDHISLLSYFEVRMWGFFCHIEKKKRETYTIFQHTNESYWKFERKQSRLKTLIYYGLKTYAFKKLKIYYTEFSECQQWWTPKSLILDIIFLCHPTLYLGTNYKHNVTSLWIDIFSKCDCFLGLHLLLHAAWLFSLERGKSSSQQFFFRGIPSHMYI